MTSDAFTSPIGVVPIFVNAGAALFPTLIASLTSVFAVLFKPKELTALIRRKPWLPVALILIIAAIWFSFTHLFSAPAQANPARTTDRTAGDRAEYWTNLAQRLIRDEENASKTTGIKPLWDYQPE